MMIIQIVQYKNIMSENSIQSSIKKHTLNQSLISINNSIKQQITTLKVYQQSSPKNLNITKDKIYTKNNYYKANSYQSQEHLKFSKNYQVTIVDTLHPEFKRNIKNCDFKNREILVKFQFYQKVQHSFQEFKSYLGVWNRQLFHNLSQQAFFGYSTEKLTEEQCKSFFSNNLILNQIKLFCFLEKHFSEFWKQQAMKILNLIKQQSSNALQFLLKDYPEKKSIYVDPAIHRIIPEMNDLDNPEHDLLKNLDLMFKYQKNQKIQKKDTYKKQIKQILNKLVKMTDKDYDKFQQNIKKIFNNQNLKKVYHKIGRKLSKQTPQYTQNQLNDPDIQIKSPQLMRVIIKWIQGLEQRITDLKKYIIKRPYKFICKNDGKKLIRFSDLQKFHIKLQFQKSQDIKKINSQLQNSLQRIGKVLTILPAFIKKNQSLFDYIQEHKIQTGLSTYALQSIITDIVVGYLVSIIQNILEFQQKISKRNTHYYDKETNFDQNFQINKFAEVSYISLGIYDLLRAKCQGTKQEIQQIYNAIKQQDSVFTIIRVKNRLTTGNRDFLLNMRMKGSQLICQFQLGLKLGDNQNKKQQYFDHFNHYLYQLKRSKFGALAQAIILNNHINSSSVSFFKNKLNKKCEKEKLSKKIETGIQYQYQFQTDVKIGFKLKELKKTQDLYLRWDEVQTFICQNCLFIKSSQNSWISNFRYKPQVSENKFCKYICGSCFFNTQFPFKSQEKKNKLLGDYSEFYQEIQPDKILKQKIGYFLIIPKSSKYEYQKYFKIEDNFFKSIKQISQLRDFHSEKKFCSFQQLNILFAYKLKQSIKWSKYSKLYYQLDHQSQFFMKQHLIQNLHKKLQLTQETQEFTQNTLNVERIPEIFQYFNQILKKMNKVSIKPIGFNLEQLKKFYKTQDKKKLVLIRNSRKQQPQYIRILILDISPDVYYKQHLKLAINKQILQQNQKLKNKIKQKYRKDKKQYGRKQIREERKQQKKKQQQATKEVILDLVDKIIIDQDFLIQNMQLKNMQLKSNQNLYNHITQLYLGNNQIKTLKFINQTIANNLVNLNLRKNFIQGPLQIKPEFVNLINLNLSYNMFKEFDDSKLTFRCLKKLNLSQNIIRELSVQKILTLKILNISNNLYTEYNKIKINSQIIKNLKYIGYLHYNTNDIYVNYLFNRILTSSQKQIFIQKISPQSQKKVINETLVKEKQKYYNIYQKYPIIQRVQFFQLERFQYQLQQLVNQIKRVCSSGININLLISHLERVILIYQNIKRFCDEMERTNCSQQNIKLLIEQFKIDNRNQCNIEQLIKQLKRYQDSYYNIEKLNFFSGYQRYQLDIKSLIKSFHSKQEQLMEQLIEQFKIVNHIYYNFEQFYDEMQRTNCSQQNINQLIEQFKVANRSQCNIEKLIKYVKPANWRSQKIKQLINYVKLANCNYKNIGTFVRYVDQFLSFNQISQSFIPSKIIFRSINSGQISSFQILIEFEIIQSTHIQTKLNNKIKKQFQQINPKLIKLFQQEQYFDEEEFKDLIEQLKKQN